MTYSEYKENLKMILMNSIKKVKLELEELKEVLVNLKLACISKNYDYFDEVNERYALGIDLFNIENYALVIPAVEKLIKCVQSEVANGEREIKCVTKDFKKSITSIPIFMANLLLNDFLLNYNYLARIYISLIKANVAARNAGQVNKLEVFENLKTSDFALEKQLLVALNNQDYETFKRISISYFEGFMVQDELDDLFNSEKVLERLSELLVVIKRMYFENRKEIDDKLVDDLIVGFNGSLNICADLLEKLEFFRDSLYFIYTDVDEFLRKIILYNMSQKFGLKWEIDISLENVRQDIQNKINKFLQEKESIISILAGLSSRGMINKCFSLPRLAIIIDQSIPDLQYLILSGIKTNGESTKNVSDETEKKLYLLEVKMAALIDHEFMVNESDITLFLELYSKYLDVYFESMEKYLLSSEDMLELKQRVMKEITKYLKSYKKENNSKLVKNPIYSFIQNGKVVKKCDLEQFRILLDNIDMSENQKLDYYRQMVNLIRRCEAEEKTNKLNKLKEKLLGEDVELLEKARMSGNIEITEVLREINALLELLVDSDLEENKDLVLELDTYVDFLREKFSKKESKPTFDTDLLIYYKNLLEAEISLALKSDYKEIKLSLNKIKEGNISQDKEVIGLNLPFKVKWKGRNFKIFYVILGEYKIIITGLKGDKAFKEIKNIVNSKEFLAYIKGLNHTILDGKDIGNIETTERIMGILENNGRGLKK